MQGSAMFLFYMIETTKKTDKKKKKRNKKLFVYKTINWIVHITKEFFFYKTSLSFLIVPLYKKNFAV